MSLVKDFWKKQYEGTHMVLWIRVIEDPFARQRGFSIAGYEFRCIGYEPVEDMMEDNRGNKMPIKGWQVEASEVFRSCPNMLHLEYARQNANKPWIFPVEFSEPFVRPANYLNMKIIEGSL